MSRATRNLANAPSKFLSVHGVEWWHADRAAKELGVVRSRVYQIIKRRAWQVLLKNGLRWVRARDVQLYKIHQRELRRARDVE